MKGTDRVVKRKYIKGIIAVILASAIYGITPIFSNVALQGGLPAEFVHKLFGNSAEILCACEERKITNESLIGISMGLACIMSLIVSLVGRKKIRITGKQTLQLSLFGGGALAATLLLISYAYLRIPAGLTIVINFTYPVFVLIALSLFFKEKFTPLRLIPLIMALAGIALISSGSFSGKIDPIGVLIAVASGITYAVYFIAGKNSAYASLDTSVSNVYITGSACIIGIIAALISGRFTLPADFFMWSLLILYSLLGYVIGLRLLLTGIKLLGSVTASALNTLEPLFVFLCSMIVFGETAGLLEGLGIFLVLASAVIAIIALRKGDKKTENKEQAVQKQ